MTRNKFNIVTIITDLIIKSEFKTLKDMSTGQISYKVFGYEQVAKDLRKCKSLNKTINQIIKSFSRHWDVHYKNDCNSS